MSLKSLRADLAPERPGPSAGFPPIAGGAARILILGSLPGQQSLQATQYYAHPQNAFWRIMADVFAVAGSYDERCAGLRSAGIAVWDVLASSVRPGSLDADIELASAQANDFVAFFAAHPAVTTVCFNGRKAEQLFERMVMPQLEGGSDRRYVGLPSTSPAFAAMRYEQKLEIWRGILRP